MPAGNRAGAFPSGTQKANQVNRRWPFLVRSRPVFGMGADLGSDDVQGVASVSASVVRTRTFSASAAGVATVSSTDVRLRARSAAATGVATVAVSVIRTRALAVSASGAATVTSATVRTRPFTGGISAAATVTTTLARLRALTASTAGSATATASFPTVKLLVASVSAGATVDAGSVAPDSQGFFGASAVSHVQYIDTEPQIDVLLRARAIGSASVSGQLSKIDLLDRELEHLLALDLIPA